MPGLTEFLVRLSAPAWKWQVAQHCTESLPTCISQNRALPSLMASVLLLTNVLRLSGCGTGIVFSDGGAARFCALAEPGPNRAAASSAAGSAMDVILGVKLFIVFSPFRASGPIGRAAGCAPSSS